jgi:hypothetical protein
MPSTLEDSYFSDDPFDDFTADVRVAESGRLRAMDSCAAAVSTAGEARQHHIVGETVAAATLQALLPEEEQRRVIERNARLLHASFALSHNTLEMHTHSPEWWQRLNGTGTFAFDGPAKAQLPLMSVPTHPMAPGAATPHYSPTRAATSHRCRHAAGPGTEAGGSKPRWQNAGGSYKPMPEAAEYRVRCSQLTGGRAQTSPRPSERERRQHGRRLDEVEHLRVELSRAELERLHTHKRLSEELAWSQTLVEQADRREKSLKEELEQVRSHLAQALDQLTIVDVKHQSELDRVRTRHLAELLAERARVDSLIERTVPPSTSTHAPLAQEELHGGQQGQERLVVEHAEVQAEKGSTEEGNDDDNYDDDDDDDDEEEEEDEEEEGEEEEGQKITIPKGIMMHAQVEEESSQLDYQQQGRPQPMPFRPAPVFAHPAASARPAHPHGTPPVDTRGSSARSLMGSPRRQASVVKRVSFDGS